MIFQLIRRLWMPRREIIIPAPAILRGEWCPACGAPLPRGLPALCQCQPPQNEGQAHQPHHCLL